MRLIGRFILVVPCWKIYLYGTMPMSHQKNVSPSSAFLIQSLTDPDTCPPKTVNKLAKRDGCHCAHRPFKNQTYFRAKFALHLVMGRLTFLPRMSMSDTLPYPNLGQHQLHSLIQGFLRCRMSYKLSLFSLVRLQALEVAFATIVRKMF